MADKIASVNLSTSIKNDDPTGSTCTLSWSASVTMGNYCYYGVGLEIKVGSTVVKTTTGYASSTGQKICKCSGTRTLTKAQAAGSVTVTARQYSTTVSGYGGVGESHSKTSTKTIPAITYAPFDPPVLSIASGTVPDTQESVALSWALGATRGNSDVSGFDILKDGATIASVGASVRSYSVPKAQYASANGLTFTVVEKHSWAGSTKTAESNQVSLTVTHGPVITPSLSEVAAERGNWSGSTFTITSQGNHLKVTGKPSYTVANYTGTPTATLQLLVNGSAVASASNPTQNATATLYTPSSGSGLTNASTVKLRYTVTAGTASKYAEIDVNVPKSSVVIDVRNDGKAIGLLREVTSSTANGATAVDKLDVASGATIAGGASVAGGLSVTGGATLAGNVTGLATAFQTATVSHNIGSTAGGAYGTAEVTIPAHAGTLLGVMQLYFHGASSRTTAIANCGVSIASGKLSITYRNVSSTSVNVTAYAVLLYAL